MDVPEACEFSDATLAEMVEAVEPTWELREAVPVERGFCSIYRLVVADGGTTRELYLKAPPDGEPHLVERATGCGVAGEGVTISHGYGTIT